MPPCIRVILLIHFCAALQDQGQGCAQEEGCAAPSPNTCAAEGSDSGTAQGHCATSLTELCEHLEEPRAQHLTAQPQPALTRRTNSKRHFLYQVAPKKAILIIKVPQSHFQEALRSLALFQGIEGRINISFKCCTIKPDAFLCGPNGALRSITKTKLETHIGSDQVEQMVKRKNI